ncbi:MAG TPA: HWE histidine kinase domain-containing protein, partial [Caulobacteraceae bacterium]|nr:HWE histidine kinase domain-containing protein [Caulobacteraceae bacterium]
QLGFSLEQRLASQRLTESEGQLRAMFEHAGVGMALMTDSGQVTAANSAFCTIADRPLADLVGRFCTELTHPDDRAANQAALEKLSAAGGSVALEKRTIRPDGSCLWVRITLSQVGDGQVLAVVEDVDARKGAEQALLETQAELKAAMEAGQLALFDMDHVAGVMRPSARLNALYGYPPDHPMTLDDIRARYHPEHGERFMAEAHGHHLDPDARQFLYLIRLAMPEGATRWVEGRGEYLRDETGAVVRSRGVLQDVTERKRWEEHQRLLVNELNHRVKNSLAIVQGLAQQSFRSGEPVDAGRRVFEARLAALSSAHDLLTRGGWESALLQEVVETSLDAALGPASDRVTCSGAPVRLSPQTSVSVALAIHELSTNALKYGALSNPTGRIKLIWGLEGDDKVCRLKIVWTESGGPAVEPPQSRGFGSRMIERGLAAELGGVARLEFRPEGLICAIDAPAPCAD